jgi:hypothetical protein
VRNGNICQRRHSQALKLKLIRIKHYSTTVICESNLKSLGYELQIGLFQLIFDRLWMGWSTRREVFFLIHR